MPMVLTRNPACYVLTDPIEILAACSPAELHTEPIVRSSADRSIASALFPKFKNTKRHVGLMDVMSLREQVQ